MDLNQNTVVHWIVLAEIASAKVLIFVLALRKIETSNIVSSPNVFMCSLLVKSVSLCCFMLLLALLGFITINTKTKV